MKPKIAWEAETMTRTFGQAVSVQQRRRDRAEQPHNSCPRNVFVELADVNRSPSHLPAQVPLHWPALEIMHGAHLRLEVELASLTQQAFRQQTVREWAGVVRQRVRAKHAPPHDHVVSREQT